MYIEIYGGPIASLMIRLSLWILFKVLMITLLIISLYRYKIGREAQ